MSAEQLAPKIRRCTNLNRPSDAHVRAWKLHLATCDLDALHDRYESELAPLRRVAQTISGGMESKKTRGNFATYCRHIERLCLLARDRGEKSATTIWQALSRPEELHATFSQEPEQAVYGRRSANLERRSPSSRNQMQWALQHLVPRLVFDGLLPESSKERLKLIKKARTEKPQVVQPCVEQVRELLARIEQEDPRVAVFTRFLAVSGMRIGGALSLKWDQIDWEAHVFRGIRSKGRALTLPMFAEARALSIRLQKDSPFRVREGTLTVFPLGSTLRKKVGQLLKGAPVGHLTHAHALRGWFVDRCRRQGLDIHEIARAIGHADDGATLLKFYSHEDAERVAAKHHGLHLLVDAPVTISLAEPAGGIDMDALAEALAKAMRRREKAA